MKNILSILTIILISFGFLQADENIFSSNLDFLPLQVGNEWQFIEIDPFSYDTSYLSFKVLTDTLMPNNKNYFELENLDDFGYGLKYLRLDSIEERVYYYIPIDDSISYPDSESVLFELILPDSGYYYTPSQILVEMDSGTVNLSFWPDSLPYYCYTFWHIYLLEYKTISIAKDIGFIQWTLNPFETYRWDIIAVKLNGQVYGNFVGIREPELSKVHTLDLYQNYPNPFNSITVIQFYHSKTEYIDLSIYTVNGQHIITLLKEKLLAGEYKVKWYGRNAYGAEISSGVYYYILKTRDNIKSKKLLFLK